MEKKERQKAKTARFNNMPNEIGKLQPQAVDLEDAVLGACLLEQDAIGEVIDILTPEAFYKEQNGLIFQSIINLYKKSSPIDLLTVVQDLKTNNALELVGGNYYVASLTNNIASSGNIVAHSRIVVECYLKREYIRLSTIGIKESYEEQSDVFDLYERGIRELEGCITGVLKYDVSSISQIHQNLLVNSIKITQSGQKSGVPTGYKNIDNFTSGWQKSDLIIIAGRPAMGKSVCALAFALNPCLNQNIPTAIFSLEMSKQQVVGRAQSTLSRIDSSKIIKNQLTMEDIRIIDDKCTPLHSAPLYIDDTPALNLLEFKGKARKLVRDKGVKLIVIDYLQLMVANVGNGNREQEISTISRGLKAIAKELDIPIIALSQLSRAVEIRAGDKRPMLSDLRESGSIEQDADMVIFCYRPEYYSFEQYELAGEVLPTTGLMSLIVAKHRAGGLGELKMGFRGELTRLEDYYEYMSEINNQTNVNNYKAPPPPPEYPSDNSVNTVFIQNEDFLNQKTEVQNQQINQSNSSKLPF